MSTTLSRIISYILIGLATVVFIVVGTIWGVNSYKFSHNIVDSCGNTAQDLTATNLLEACATISGHVEHVLALSNGDLQVQLEPNLDGSFARNNANQRLQNGNLLVRLTCSNTANLPTQYFQTCAAFNTTGLRAVPKTTLTYTGNLIINKQFGWIEMSPSAESPGA